MAEREALSLPTPEDDMEDFSPRRAGQGGQTTMPAAETRRSIDAVSSFPSREAEAVKQLNLKGPAHILDRFRAMCKADRRSYYDMLDILMDRYERSS